MAVGREVFVFPKYHTKTNINSISQSSKSETSKQHIDFDSTFDITVEVILCQILQYK